MKNVMMEILLQPLMVDLQLAQLMLVMNVTVVPQPLPILVLSAQMGLTLTLLKMPVSQCEEMVSGLVQKSVMILIPQQLLMAVLQLAPLTLVMLVQVGLQPLRMLVLFVQMVMILMQPKTLELLYVEMDSEQALKNVMTQILQQL